MSIARVPPVPTGPAPERPARILLVDEEEPLTDLVSIALRFEGWEVGSAGSGAEAIATTRTFRPDVVLLDMMLPDMSGVDVAAALRSDGTTAHVIFVTGRDSLDDRLAAYGNGGDDYITKPFGLDDLVSTLREHFRRTGLSRDSEVFGRVVLDRVAKEAWRDRQALFLRPLDVEVLRAVLAAEAPVDGDGIRDDLRAGGMTVDSGSLRRSLQRLSPAELHHGEALIETLDDGCWREVA